MGAHTHTQTVPNELFAVTAKCWLLKEAGYELVIFDVVDKLLTEGATSGELFQRLVVAFTRGIDRTTTHATHTGSLFICLKKMKETL
jgi:hypothetical protein